MRPLSKKVSFEILKEMQGFPRILVGLANDQLGYIITEYDFRPDSYEETMSPGKATTPAVLSTKGLHWRRGPDTLECKAD